MTRSLADQQETWDRLRADPEFHPSWLRFMGPRPTDVAHRTWGDGATSSRPHVIESTSFSLGRTLCRCGAEVQQTDTLTLEDAWDVHRGRGDLVVDRALGSAMRHSTATDAEVASFLGRVADPLYRFEVS